MKTLPSTTSVLSSNDWMRSREALSDRGRANGSVSYAQPGQRYTGPIVLVTQTHVVQQVAPNHGVAHEMARIHNAAEVHQALDALRPGLAAPRLLIRYEGDRAIAEPSAVKAAEVADMRRLAVSWANAAISNATSREDFIRHAERFMTELADPRRLNPLNAPLAQFARYLAEERPNAGAEASARIEDRLTRYRHAVDDTASWRGWTPGPAETLQPTVVPKDSGARPTELLVGATAAIWARLDVDELRKLQAEIERLQRTVGRAEQRSDADKAAAAAIERNWERIHASGDKPLAESVLRQMAREDMASLMVMTTADRRFAAVAMSESARTQPAYQAELQQQSPNIAREVQEAAAEEARRLAAKEDRKAAEIAAVRAQELAAEAARRAEAEARAREAQHNTGPDLVVVALAAAAALRLLEAQRDKAVSLMGSNTSVRYQEAVREIAPDIVPMLAAHQLPRQQTMLAVVDAHRGELARHNGQSHQTAITAAMSIAAPVANRQLARDIER